MTKFNYALEDYSLKKALLWGNCVSHWKEAETGDLAGRKVHRLIAIIEAVPLLGQIASLIEYLVVKLFGSMGKKGISETNDVRVSEINTDQETISSFNHFIKEFELEILPLYKQHEESFDHHGVHGRMHASRAMLFAELMARYLMANGQEIDLDLLRRTIGLHDAGREGNGKDIWEKESAEILRKHLIEKGMDEEEAFIKSRMIVKRGDRDLSLEAILFSSADSVDIMRPCTGHGGRKGFNKNYFLFLKGSETGSKDFRFREAFIEEAWAFIQRTERMKGSLADAENSGYIDSLLNVIRENPKKFPILSNLIVQ